MKIYKSIKLLEGILIELENNSQKLININFGKYFDLDLDLNKEIKKEKENIYIDFKKGFAKYLTEKYKDFNESILDKNYYEIKNKNEFVLNEREFNFIGDIKENKIKELLEEFNKSLCERERIKDLDNFKIKKIKKVFNFKKFFANFGMLFMDNGEKKTFYEINKILKKEKIGNLKELNTVEKLINDGGKNLKIKKKFEVEISFDKNNKDYEINEKIHDMTSLFFFEKSNYTIYNIEDKNG